MNCIPDETTPRNAAPFGVVHPGPSRSRAPVLAFAFALASGTSSLCTRPSAATSDPSHASRPAAAAWVRGVHDSAALRAGEVRRRRALLRAASRRAESPRREAASRRCSGCGARRVARPSSAGAAARRAGWAFLFLRRANGRRRAPARALQFGRTPQARRRSSPSDGAVSPPSTAPNAASPGFKTCFSKRRNARRRAAARAQRRRSPPSAGARARAAPCAVRPARSGGERLRARARAAPRGDRA